MSSSSASNPTQPPIKAKFKLDPMSLLLPHERQLYAARNTASSSSSPQEPYRAASPGLGLSNVNLGNMGGSGYAGSSDWSKGQQNNPLREHDEVRKRCILTRRLATYGSSQQQPTQAMPISPPASLVSTPPIAWDSASQASAFNVTSPVDHAQPLYGRRPQYGHSPNPSYSSASSGKARLEDWEVVETLGTGTFGRVLLVRQRPNYRPTAYHPIFPHLYQSTDPLSPSPAATQHADQQIPHFAMKVLKKSEIVRLKQVEHINSERNILDKIRHPFIVELYSTYQDQLNVYMLLSYIPGGELFSHLRRAGRFSADVTRFYLASIILAIEYLHAKDIIYRDLKPENLLLDRTGYLRIADFGFSKIVQDRTYTLCGTPEYLAPEIVLSQGHGKPVDWWALGILAFEMLAGYPPFFDDHPLGIYEKILRNEIAFPSHIDPYAKDLIRGLLTADRSRRLGNLRGGAKDVMKHAWFAGVDWGSLERKEIGAPIVPRVASMGE